MLKNKKNYLMIIMIFLIAVGFILFNKTITIEPEVSTYLTNALENQVVYDEFEAEIILKNNKVILDILNKSDEELYSNYYIADVCIKKADGWHNVKMKDLLFGSSNARINEPLRFEFSENEIFGGRMIKGEYIFDIFFNNNAGGKSYHIYYPVKK